MIPFLVEYVIVKIILTSVEELKAKLEAANQAIKDNNSPVTVEGFQPATPELGNLNWWFSIQGYIGCQISTC